MPDDPTTQAFLYGPLVLAGDLGDEGLTDQLTVGSNVAAVAPRLPLEIPTFQAVEPRTPRRGSSPPTSRSRSAPPASRRTSRSHPINTIFGQALFRLLASSVKVSAIALLLLDSGSSRLLSLSTVDLAIIAIYFAMVLGIGFYLKRYTKTGEDFFLAGREMTAWVAG